MKIKSLVMTIAAVLASSGAMASESNASIKASEIENKLGFWINSRTTPGIINYYNCDLVESLAEEILTELGATNIKARCTGGIDSSFGAREAYLRLNFQSLQSSDEGTISSQFKTIEIKGHDHCPLANQIVNEVQGKFELNGGITSKKCRGGQNDAFKFQGEVLKAN